MAATPRDPIGAALSGGRYVLTVKLGEGGMGAVYRATDRNLGADVVIKVPHPGMAADPEFARRFRDEVRSLVRLSHPHVVKVTDVGDWDGTPFAVLQYLPGGSLEDRLAAWRGPAGLAALGGWLGPVADALDYVHARGMVHRDVKPANILFDAQGNAFLGDFGVVKVLAAAADGRPARTAATAAGLVLGTPLYMAPELILGDPFDGRADQYALAVTAYELLCGRRPFEHEVSTRVMLMQAHDPPPSPTALCPWMAPRLAQVLLKGLTKAPAGRYPSCAAFAAAVVEASGVGAGGRARLRCGSCGQTIGVTVEVLAKLSRGGRTAPCPRCRGPLDLAAGTATVLPPSPSGAEPHAPAEDLDVRGGTGEMPAVRPSPRTTPARPPAPVADRTVVLGGARPPAARTAVEGTARPPAIGKTVLQAPARPPATAAEGPARGRTTPAWAPVAAAVVALVAGGAITWAALRPPAPEARRDAAPVAPPRTAAAPPARPADAPSSTPVAVVASRAEPPSVGRPARRPDSPPPPRIEPRPEPDPEPAPRPETAPAPVPDSEWADLRNVPLARLLADPAAYAGRLLTLEQVYCLSHRPCRAEDGTLHVALVEADLELTASSVRVRHGRRHELAIDPGLVRRLVELRLMAPPSADPAAVHEWLMRPANLTVKVPDSPEAASGPGSAPSPGRIVRAELFHGFRNEVRGTAKKILVVRFETELVTPTEVSTGLGDAEEWKRVGKLAHAYNQFHRFFEGMQRQYSHRRWQAFSSQMDRMIVEGTRRSAAANAATETRLRSLMLPR